MTDQDVERTTRPTRVRWYRFAARGLVVAGFAGGDFSTNDQQRLARQDEEVLLVCLPVVHRHRLARPEDEEVDTELRVVVADEIVDEAARAAVPPPHVTEVPDEPAHPAGTLSPQAVQHDVEIAPPLARRRREQR